MSGARAISDGRTVHLGTSESGNLKTVCGLSVRGGWRLVDGSRIECPVCAKREAAS